MINPFLRRAIWLDTNQRETLATAAESAREHPKSDSVLCQNVIQEIRNAEEDFRKNSNSLVLIVIRGLRLPRTALPIYLCHAEIYEVLNYTKVNTDSLRELLNGVD